MEHDLVLLTIADVKVAVPAGNGIEAGLVVMREEEEPNRQMRMIVGQPEARAIHVPWSNGVPPRPSTWDLFVSTLSILDTRIDHVVVTDVQEGRHFFAQLVLYREGVEEPLMLTARPSDAIALALRAWGAKIYCRPHVLDEAGLLSDGSHWARARPQPAADGPDVGAPLGGPAAVVEDESLIGGWMGTADSSASRRSPLRQRPLTAPGRTAGGRTASKSAASKSAASKSAASKSAASKSAASKTAAAKTAASKTAAAKTAASKTAASERAAAKTAAARKMSKPAVTKAAATTKSVTAKRAATGKPAAAKATPAKKVSKSAASPQAPARRSSAASTRTAAKAVAVEAVSAPPTPDTD